MHTKICLRTVGSNLPKDLSISSVYLKMTRTKNLPECLLKLNSGYCAQISSCNPCIGLVILDTFGIINCIPKISYSTFFTRASLSLMSALCKRISSARKKAGLTQEALADRLQITRAACSHWEQGISNPSAKNLIMLCQILEVNHEWLVLGQGEMYARIAETAQGSRNKPGDLQTGEGRGEYKRAMVRTDPETVQFSEMFFALSKTQRKVIIDMLNLLTSKKSAKRKSN